MVYNDGTDNVSEKTKLETGIDERDQEIDQILAKLRGYTFSLMLRKAKTKIDCVNAIKSGQKSLKLSRRKTPRKITPGPATHRPHRVAKRSRQNPRSSESLRRAAAFVMQTQTSKRTKTAETVLEKRSLKKKTLPGQLKPTNMFSRATRKRTPRDTVRRNMSRQPLLRMSKINISLVLRHEF